MGTLRAIVVQHAGSSPIPVYPPNDVTGPGLGLTIYFVTKHDTVSGRVNMECVYPSIILAGRKPEFKRSWRGNRLKSKTGVAAIPRHQLAALTL